LVDLHGSTGQVDEGHQSTSRADWACLIRSSARSSSLCYHGTTPLWIPTGEMPG
jgi:hypothetical protein